jgi:pyruvate dehydrogenase E1 component alpha subunit
MPAVSADGNDVETVASLARSAAEQARNGHGPQFLEFAAYRWREHCGPEFDDHLKYRSVQEIEAGMKNCPIDQYKKILMHGGGLDEQACAGIEAQILEEVSAAFAFALASSKPTIKDAWEKVYA